MANSLLWIQAAPVLGRRALAGRKGVYLPHWTHDPHFQRGQASLAAVHREGLQDASWDPGPGPMILTLLGSTTSFTGTWKGLPRKEVTGF